MLLTVPYKNDMRIGQGFNSYTHEICIDNAVTSTSTASKKPQAGSETPSSSTAATPVVQPTPSPASIASHPQQAPETQPENASTVSKPDKIISKLVTTSNLAANAKPTSTSPEPSSGSAVNSQPVPAVQPKLTEKDLPYHIAHPMVWDSTQSVTYSSWQINSVSEIVDSLNLSTFALVKYASVEANINSSFIHDSKLRDSQLNYMVTVKVSNDSVTAQEDLTFQPIDDLPPERFTHVYGDTFISGFIDGGEFHAIISIKVNDKSKLKKVKEAVDFQLAIPTVPGLSVGAGGGWDSSSSDIFQNTEITISVKNSGGGVIKHPGSQWSLQTVIAVANAFPSLVAKYPAKTAAILTRYDALRSFQSWKYAMAKSDQPAWKAFVAADDHWQNRLILSYAPCKIYTAAIFEDLLAYQALDRRIKSILKEPSQYKAKVPIKINLNPQYETVFDEPIGAEHGTADDNLKRIAKQLNTQTTRPKISSSSSRRTSTFQLIDPDVTSTWILEDVDATKDPIPLDITALKEALLICRGAITLITEEAERLKNHPDLAYAEFNDESHRISINRSNYPMPEMLETRLPIYVGNDAVEGILANDEAVLMTMKYAHGDDLYFHLIGDAPHPQRRYQAFSSLDLAQPTATTKHKIDNRIARLSVHSYQHKWWKFSRFSKESHCAIGAIGFDFARSSILPHRKQPKEDGCIYHVGRSTATGSNVHTLALTPHNENPIDIVQIKVSYVPGSGRIVGLAFYEKANEAPLEALGWQQWLHDDSDGREPEGVKQVIQAPPNDGTRWRFVGVCGEFDRSIYGSVLARVSGVWRRV